MEVPRQRMETEIIQFVRQHPESTASLAISRYILGERPRGNSETMWQGIQRHISNVPTDVLESCYYLVK